VVMWSIGNEVGEQWKPEIGLPIASNLVATCHAEDPTRPVTIGCDARATWTNGYVQVVDVFGVNYKADHYGDFYRLFPGKGLVGTETESLLSTRDAYYFPEDDDWGSLERPNRRGMYDFQVSSYEKYTIRPSN
ncbi:MAG: beta-galactosidase, partial [bacterium]|nr:beta-galactosidase [bacterium]